MEFTTEPLSATFEAGDLQLRGDLQHIAVFWWGLSLVANIILHLLGDRSNEHPVLNQLIVIALLVSFLSTAVVLIFPSMSIRKTRILVHLTVFFGAMSLALLGLCSVTGIIGLIAYAIGLIVVLIVFNPIKYIWDWAKSAEFTLMGGLSPSVEIPQATHQIDVVLIQPSDEETGSPVIFNPFKYVWGWAIFAKVTLMRGLFQIVNIPPSTDPTDVAGIHPAVDHIEVVVICPSDAQPGFL